MRCRSHLDKGFGQVGEDWVQGQVMDATMFFSLVVVEVNEVFDGEVGANIFDLLKRRSRQEAFTSNERLMVLSE